MVSQSTNITYKVSANQAVLARDIKVSSPTPFSAKAHARAKVEVHGLLWSSRGRYRPIWCLPTMVGWPGCLFTQQQRFQKKQILQCQLINLTYKSSLLQRIGPIFQNCLLDENCCSPLNCCPQGSNWYLNKGGGAQEYLWRHKHTFSRKI